MFFRDESVAVASRRRGSCLLKLRDDAKRLRSLHGETRFSTHCDIIQKNMPASLQINFGSEQLVLLADRAIHWPARKTLIVADVHLGKDATFRAVGLSVPAGNSAKDLARIESLISFTGSKRLVILGDLVHGKASHQPELAAAFSKWRAAHSQLDVLLIRGNHDRRAGPPPADWQIEQVTEPFDDGALMLGHEPQITEKPLLCGHVHPTVAVRDFDRSYASMPCFVVDPMQIILPAFGSFTGGYKMWGEPGRRIFAVAGKSVVELPKIDIPAVKSAGNS